MAVVDGNLLMGILGLASALWCAGLAFALVQTDRGERTLSLVSALAGFAAVLLLAGTYQRKDADSDKLLS